MAHKDNFGEIKNVKEDYHEYLTDIMHCMNSNARKTASYKYVFFKSILDNLFNVNENLEISFDDLSRDFSIIYWNIIAKYKLPQYQNGRQSLMEKHIYQFISLDEMIDEVDFYSLKEDVQEEYLKITKNVISINVVGALYSDFNEVIYGFDKKRKVIWFNENSYRFLIEYKSTLEKLNYYAWILWIENILRIRYEEASNLATKLECSNKRKSLERFKDELKLKGDEEKCFYCGSKISICNCHLDHFIPWSFVHDDKIWNLVYSCSNCNTSKNDRIPNGQFLLKIQSRNKSLLNNSYEKELNRLYNAALHNGFACWEKRNKWMSNYYKEHKDEFIDSTINCDMSFHYNMFEKYLSDDAKTILDIGFGSGRDSLFFSKKYEVYSIDPLEEFCEHAKELGLKNVHCQRVQDIEYVNMFDGIWACASLLHIPTYEMVDVLNKCYGALKVNGVMYCSFKRGEFEGERNGRFFLDLIEERFRQFVSKTKFQILEVFITEDVRIDRTEKWLNVILKKL